MTQAHAHLGYAPRGAGLLYGLLWFAHDDDILGWFIGDHDGEPLAAYFVLQDYAGARTPQLLHSAQNDIYGRWLETGPDGVIDLPHPPPLPEDQCHELMRLQYEFIRHWLFFGNDPDATDEARAFREQDLPVRGVNPRAVRLGKFRHGAAIWRYDAPGADTGVLCELSQLWPLDHQVDD
jgi:hypothetical protein